MVQVGRKRILFFGSATSLSHVARPAVLCQQLDPQRYEVLLACHPRYNQLLGLPFEPLPISSLLQEQAMRTVYLGQPLFETDMLEAQVQEDLALFRTVAPDLVVGDLRLSLGISSRLAGIPYVNVIDAHWSPYANVEVEIPANPMVGLFGEDLADMLFKLTMPFGSVFHTMPFNVVRLRHGLPPVGIDVRYAFTDGDYTLYPDAPELIPTRSLPATHSYLGPILWSPKVALPDWWDALPADRPIVYLNLGSTGQHALMRDMLRELSELPITVIATTLGHASSQVRAANIFLADYLPGEAATQRSSLVICNGGTMSTQQALSAGVPVLGVASNLDQVMFMKEVARTGAAVLLHERHASGRAVKQHVATMLFQPSYGQQAQRLSAAFQRYDSGQAFRDLIDRVCAAN